MKFKYVIINLLLILISSCMPNYIPGDVLNYKSDEIIMIPTYASDNFRIGLLMNKQLPNNEVLLIIKYKDIKEGLYAAYFIVNDRFNRFNPITETTYLKNYQKYFYEYGWTLNEFLIPFDLLKEILENENVICRLQTKFNKFIDGEIKDFGFPNDVVNGFKKFINIYEKTIYSR